MGVSIGSRLKAVAMIIVLSALFLAAFAGTQPEKACARANLTAYLTVPPTDWEPLGYNLTGTAPWFIVQSLGWNAVKIRGNVGIGDGSMRSLNLTSNENISYIPDNFMAADVSMAPLNAGRLSSFQQAANVSAANNAMAIQANASATNASQASNNTGHAMLSIPGIAKLNFAPAIQNESYRQQVNDASLQRTNDTGTQQANNTTAQPAIVTTQPTTGYKMALNDPYHSILMGRPVDDLLYEYPLSQSITMYSRLTGLMMPCGCPANIGMRCCGYGY